ncbi:alpha/beta fold hydrolase [Kistimonas asteriae]|uniref:alpha/beta fold hydrolase n=1 Tax=Kistimonas asteriae TaxID=517724 RepID=UPI001BACABD4
MKEFKITTPDMTFAACQWGRDDAPAILALHGWLDNAATFSRLAPLIDEYRIIAIDQAGHGFSEHRGPDASYAIWDYVGDLIEIADALALERFSLLGHSMGAIVSVLTAGAFPERVERLMLIDGIWPMPTEVDQAPEQLAKAIKHRIRLRSRNKSVFASKDEAVAARLRGFGTISEAAARILVERGVEPCDGGWTWRTDARLTLPSAMRLTHAHAQAFTNRLSMPTLLIAAEGGIVIAGVEAHQGELDHIAIKTLPGGHHLHIEEQAEAVAEAMGDFLSSA